MLERYLERHHELFGDTARAEQERGEVYELLYEFERRLPDPTDTDTPASDDDGGAADTEALADEPPEVDDEREDPESDHHRIVHVDTRYRHPLEEIHRRLEAPYSNDELAFVFTSPEIVEVHGPRPLVRARWSTDPDTPKSRRKAARKWGDRLVDRARPELLECYTQALGRRVTEHQRVSVGLVVGEDGTIESAEVQTGSLVDPLGDRCVLEALDDADPGDGAPLLAELQLIFFVEGELLVREADGRMLRTVDEMTADALTNTRPPPPTSPRGMVPIDQFN